MVLHEIASAGEDVKTHFLITTSLAVGTERRLHTECRQWRGEMERFITIITDGEKFQYHVTCFHANTVILRVLPCQTRHTCEV